MWTREYFCLSRLCAVADTGERARFWDMRTNTAIYKHGICPKIYTAGFFRLKNFTPSISPNFNNFSGKKHKKCVKMEKFTPLAKVLHLTEWLFLPKICQSSFSFGKRLFVLARVVSGCHRKWQRVLSAWRSPRGWLTFHSQTICPAGKGVPLHYELPATDGEIKVL